MNYREQARADLQEFARTVLGPAIKEDVERLMGAADLTEEEATFFVREELRSSLRGQAVPGGQNPT